MVPQRNRRPAVAPDVTAVSEALIRIVLTERGRPASADAGMEPHEIRAAVHLAGRDDATIGELARASGITIGWASRVVDALERRGHVERRRDERDGRVTRIRLSETARAMIERTYRWRGEVIERRLAELTPDQRAAVARFLAGVANDLEAGPPTNDQADAGRPRR